MFSPNSPRIVALFRRLQLRRRLCGLLPLLLLLSGGCAEKPAPIQVQSAPIVLPQAERFHPPRPKPLQLNIFDWLVLNPGDSVKGGPLSCTTPKGYETMSLNMAEIDRWVIETDALLDYYEKQK